jgi:phosphoenolpyruvate synthase/pyruvate phosphate dikinase
LINNLKNKDENINFHYMTLGELKDFAKTKRLVEKGELSRRERESVYHRDFKDLFVGDDASSFLSKFNIEEEGGADGLEIKLLEGMTACLGPNGDWVYGEVRIINSSADMNKMREGDVLVSVATTPEILLAMKKAAAIVTDHGGITCHAAIVSRELNKPCLIGTKYATKVFKDGDKVIVCPRHGYIKFE